MVSLMLCVSPLAVSAKQHDFGKSAVLYRSLLCVGRTHVLVKKGACGDSSVVRRSTTCLGKAKPRSSSPDGGQLWCQLR